MAHAHPTANRAPSLITQSQSPADSSKDGTVKEWPMDTSYFRRPLAKNKAPGPPMMDYGSYGPMIKV